MLLSPRKNGLTSLFKEVRVSLRLLNRLNNFNTAITGLINSRHSPSKMTLTGLNLKSRKALTALFNQVGAPLERLNNPVTAALNYLINLAASG